MKVHSSLKNSPFLAKDHVNVTLGLTKETLTNNKSLDHPKFLWNLGSFESTTTTIQIF